MGAAGAPLLEEEVALRSLQSQAPMLLLKESVALLDEEVALQSLQRE